MQSEHQCKSCKQKMLNNYIRWKLYKVLPDNINFYLFVIIIEIFCCENVVMYSASTLHAIKDLVYCSVIFNK
jgi:hypothetical protein